MKSDLLSTVKMNNLNLKARGLEMSWGKYILKLKKKAIKDLK